MTKRAGRTVAETPLALVKHPRGASADTEVLVGGQALSVWIVRYGLPLPPGLPVVTCDADCLTQVFHRRGLGRAIRPRHRRPGDFFATTRPDGTCRPGRTRHLRRELRQRRRGLQIVGLDPAKVLARAVRVELTGATTFLVMHPFDLLKSRLASLHALREKQNETGAAQLRLAIDVARAHLQEQAARYLPTGGDRRRPQPDPDLGVEIEELAIDDAGRKVAKRWGVHVADAIDPSLIPAGAFWTRKWPGLKALMSDEYANRFVVPLAPIKPARQRR